MSLLRNFIFFNLEPNLLQWLKVKFKSNLLRVILQKKTIISISNKKLVLYYETHGAYGS